MVRIDGLNLFNMAALFKNQLVIKIKMTLVVCIRVRISTPQLTNALHWLFASGCTYVPLSSQVKCKLLFGNLGQVAYSQHGSVHKRFFKFPRDSSNFEFDKMAVQLYIVLRFCLHSGYCSLSHWHNFQLLGEHFSCTYEGWISLQILLCIHKTYTQLLVHLQPDLQAHLGGPCVEWHYGS